MKMHFVTKMNQPISPNLQAAHDVLSKGGDVRNGTDIVQTIIRMGSYMSDIQGIEVKEQPINDVMAQLS